MIIWKAVVIATVMGSPTYQMNDDAAAGYSSPQECYARTAVIIREMAMNLPVIQAIAICVQLPKTNETPSPAAKPKGKPVSANNLEILDGRPLFR